MSTIPYEEQVCPACYGDGCELCKMQGVKMLLKPGLRYLSLVPTTGTKCRGYIDRRDYDDDEILQTREFDNPWDAKEYLMTVADKLFPDGWIWENEL